MIRAACRIPAALDRRLDAVITFVYGPLPVDEHRVGLGAKLAMLLLFAALLAIGAAAR